MAPMVPAAAMEPERLHRALLAAGIAGSVLLALYGIEGLLLILAIGPLDGPDIRLFWRATPLLQQDGQAILRPASALLSAGMAAGVLGLALRSATRPRWIPGALGGLWILGIALHAFELLQPGWRPYSIRAPTPWIEGFSDMGAATMAFGAMAFGIVEAYRRSWPILPCLVLAATPPILAASIFLGPDPAMEMAYWGTLAVALAVAWLCWSALRGVPRSHADATAQPAT
jgi:hypothetical protein